MARTGRPKKSEEEMKVLPVVLTLSQHTELKKEAANQGVTMSQIIRFLVSQYLDSAGAP